ncbi:MAG: hypothetical protein H0Z31_08775 [Bacillus sp. (in: Bacteria)]|nr:hypothetical protein [Bacillus sp. (in: firmicutes)]
MSWLIFKKFIHMEAKGGDSSGNKKPQDSYLSVAREAACGLPAESVRHKRNV